MPHALAGLPRGSEALKARDAQAGRPLLVVRPGNNSAVSGCGDLPDTWARNRSLFTTELEPPP